MKHNNLSLLLLILALLLTACQGATTSVPGSTAGETPTDTFPAPTAAIQTNEPQVTATGGAAAGAACTVISPQPTPGPTEQSLFPPVSPADWISGPDPAAVTIIEYSDFQ